jgi:diguanylate cyclase (GGDEF)-like protein
VKFLILEIMDENELRSEKRRFMMTLMDIVFLIAHVILLIFFLCLGIRIMSVMNILSVICYSLLVFLLYKKNLKVAPAIWITISEVWIHLTLALYCVGWSCGFQLYCLGLVSIIFFSSYGADKNDSLLFHPLQASIISMGVYFSMEFYTSEYPPVYAVSPFMQKVMFTANSLLIFFLVITFSKVYSDLIRSSEQTFRREADLDELTHLYNRRKMREVLGMFHDGYVRDAKNYCVGMFDIDDFKKINDTYGHDAGDYVLVTIGKILVSHSSDTAKVCRWGGEEFLYVESYDSDFSDCLRHVDAIRKDVEDMLFVYGSASFRLTVTAGVAKSDQMMTISRVIAKADENLYIGKNTGKNRVVTR